jgi:hypothetical protein
MQLQSCIDNLKRIGTWGQAANPRQKSQIPKEGGYPVSTLPMRTNPTNRGYPLAACLAISWPSSGRLVAI